MKHLARGLCFAIPLAVAPVASDDPAVPPEDGESPSSCEAVDYTEVAPGEEDPLSVPLTDGIVWYGRWEDAMAEKERTGKPVMLHFGSPRCPTKGVQVPGAW